VSGGSVPVPRETARRGLRVVWVTALVVALLATGGRTAPAGAVGPAGTGRTAAADRLGAFTAVTAGFTPTKVVTGPDGNLWVATSSGPIWRFDTAGAVVDSFGFDFHVTDLVAVDGNMWVTSTERDAVGRITPAGGATWFTDPTMADPAGIVVGPDGALWFTNQGNGSIGRITTAGDVSNLASPDLEQPADLAFGEDGNLWVADVSRHQDDGAIVKMTTAGATTAYPLDRWESPAIAPHRIIAGPDGKLWFVGGWPLGGLATVTTSGTIEGTGTYGMLADLALGADGNVWVTDYGTWEPNTPPYDPGSIVRVTPNLAVDRFRTKGDGPAAIASGPDGNLWFVNGGKMYHHPPAAPSSLGRVTPTGEVSGFDVAHLAQPKALTMGPDGNVWAADWGAQSASSIAPEGAVSMHPVAIAAGWIARGPDGNLWTTGFVPEWLESDAIVRTTPAGDTTRFTGTAQTPVRSGPIASGPDGNLWIHSGPSRITRVTPTGVRTNFDDAAVEDLGSETDDIVAGPDGNVWFTNGSSIGRITPAGVVTTSKPASGAIAPRQLAFDPQGNLWFVDASHRLGRRSADGAFTLFPADDRIHVPQDLAVAPDGTLWFTNTPTAYLEPGSTGGNLGRMTPAGSYSFFASPLIAGPTGIIVGPDDDLWVADASLGSLVRVGWSAGTPPGPPTDVTVAALARHATVSWHAPAAEGSSPITSYTVTASPGGRTCTWTTGPLTCALDDLRVGGSYRFTVTATSAEGPGAASAPTAPPVLARFTDVPAGVPFDADIAWLANEGIANGSADGSFRPQAAVDRQSMAAFLYRSKTRSWATGSPSCSDAPFTDVPVGSPFCGEIGWLKGSTIVRGYPDGSFHPNESVSREAMAAFLYRMKHFNAPPPPCTAKPFADVGLDHPFCGAIAWMKATGISTGWADGTYRPRDRVARQAMAAFLHRLDELP